MMASRDGYCTICVFDERLPTHHTQQVHLQLQSLAIAHGAQSPTKDKEKESRPAKRPVTPSPSGDESAIEQGPPQKKRRAVLTHHGTDV